MRGGCYTHGQLRSRLLQLQCYQRSFIIKLVCVPSFHVEMRWIRLARNRKNMHSKDGTDWNGRINVLLYAYGTVLQ